MKKTMIIMVMLSLLFAAGFLSCKKKDTTPEAPLQNPLPAFLSQAGLTSSASYTSEGNAIDRGISFMPLVDGKITAFTAKIPAINGSLKVTLWDKASRTALRTGTVNVSAANKEASVDIAPVSLIKNKEYIISLFTNDYYEHTKPGGAAIAFPVTVGDIKITGSVYTSSGSLSDMPDEPDATTYYGDVSFKFQK